MRCGETVKNAWVEVIFKDTVCLCEPVQSTFVFLLTFSFISLLTYLPFLQFLSLMLNSLDSPSFSSHIYFLYSALLAPPCLMVSLTPMMSLSFFFTLSLFVPSWLPGCVAPSLPSVGVCCWIKHRNGLSQQIYRLHQISLLFVYIQLHLPSSILMHALTQTNGTCLKHTKNKGWNLMILLFMSFIYTVFRLNLKKQVSKKGFLFDEWLKLEIRLHMQIRTADYSFGL